MKIILATLLALCFVAAVFADTHVLSDYMINKINSDKTSTWTAGRNKIFEGKTLAEVKHMLGAFLIVPETNHMIKTSYNVDASAVPTSFDSETQWPQCKHPIRNQARCGSCWAFSAAEALTDRLCIATNAATNIILSPQDMVSCDKSNYGCDGGYLTLTWSYLENTGIVSDACFPYKSGGGFVPSCPNACDSSSASWTKHKANQGSTVQFADITSAQTSIQTYGPIQTGFQVYQDFFSYTSGVYQHKSGGLAGGHAVKVNGWGVTSASTPYWIVANSWSADWGLNGYFWILRGSNECSFESQMIAGTAATN